MEPNATIPPQTPTPPQVPLVTPPATPPPEIPLPKGMESMPAGKGGSGAGALIGIVLIIIILLLGGLYIWGGKLEEQQSQNATTAAPGSVSDEVADIQADLDLPPVEDSVSDFDTFDTSLEE